MGQVHDLAQDERITRPVPLIAARDTNLHKLPQIYQGTMIAKELMIGDWVMNTYNQKPEHVCEIRERMVMLDYNDLYDYDDIEPVPLTDAILKANGFNHRGGASYWHEGDRDACILHWSEDKEELVIGSLHDDYMIKMNVLYVHELQHAFRLAGIDKEIKLEN